MNNTDEMKKTFQRRNFYTVKDSANIFLYIILFPLLFGFLYSLLGRLIVANSGIQFPEGSNELVELFNNYSWFSIPYTLLTQIVFIGVYFCYHKVNRIQIKACNLNVKKTNPWIALLCAGLGIVCVLGMVCLIEGCFGHMFSVFGLKPSEMEIPLNTIGWYFVNLLILGVVPAFAEELIFRGVIYQGLREKFGVVSRVLLCGLIFALSHMGIEQFIYPFILGCVLSLVMEKTNNLVYPMLLHMFNNFTTITMAYLVNIGAIQMNFPMNWWFVLLSIFLALVVGAILYCVFRFVKFKRLEVEQEGENTQTPPMAFGKFPLTMVIAMVFAAIMIVINMVG